MRLAIRPSITLSNGEIVHHRYMDNGAQEAYFTSEREMTSEEWEEYCTLLRSGQAYSRQPLKS